MKKKGTKNLTYEQRKAIETLFKAKVHKAEIAKQLGINIRTLYYELKKGAYEHLHKQDTFWYGIRYKKIESYSADLAQRKYEYACSAKGRDLKIGNDYELINYIENRVKHERITAHAVLGEINRNKQQFKTSFSKTTLYRYIRIGIFNNIKIEKRKEKYKKVVLRKYAKGTSIEDRPLEIAQRNTFGHWEMDCVCGGTKPVLLTLSERLTRYEIVFKMENQKNDSVIKCLDKLERRFGSKFKKIFKTITVDNGSEFLNYSGLEKSLYSKYKKRTKIYYCHPYCSSERGTNERLNREIRRLIPKGSNIAKYTEADIKDLENWLNTYPRQVLGFATSKELFNNHLATVS